MNGIKSFLLAFLVVLLFTSCQKELNFETSLNGDALNILSAKIDGVQVVFKSRAVAKYCTPLTDLYFEGYVSDTSTQYLLINVDKYTFGPDEPVRTGTYTNEASGPGVHMLAVVYHPGNGEGWLARGFSNNRLPVDPFTVTITILTPTRVTGTFSGTIRNVGGTGPLTMQVSDGIFDLPL